MDIGNQRLENQQINQSQFKAAAELVDWMGAMQAQDYAMMKWAVGVRLPETNEHAVEEALDRGDILRTHVLRPTWHLVSAGNIRWMLALTAARIKASMKSRLRDLELTDDVITKSNTLIENALRDKKHLTREVLISEFERNGIDTWGNRASHLLMWAELDGLICSGPLQGKKQTYALLDERVPKKEVLHREEALARLAKLYFTSHGPATLQDFTWWSGLTGTEAKQALASVKADLLSERVGARELWFADHDAGRQLHGGSVHLLPAFDEFVISYADRSDCLPFADHNKAVSNNGIFRPVIVVNGQVVGIWKRTINKETVIVEGEFFAKPGEDTIMQIEGTAAAYGRFLGKEALFVGIG